MLDRRSIPIKLALAVGIPVAASLLFAVLALRTVEQVRIGGTTYNNVARVNDLKADVLPPPLFIIESFSVAQEMPGAQDQADFQILKAELDTLREQFEAAHQKWVGVLDPSVPAEAQLDKLLVQDAYQSGSQFYALVASDLYPAVETGLRTGNHQPARDVVADRLDPVFEQHKASVTEAIPLLNTRVATLEGGATTNARRSTNVLFFALAGLTLTALVLAALVVRAIVRPIRRLARAADEVATALRDTDLEQEAPELDPIELNSSPELNQAAESFNTLIGTTTDLLDRHARMRRNLGEIFQNLGRRNHGLLTRSLQVITELEQNETDSDTLDRLFRVDHLATRMRRNAENLLVLAGSQSARPAERQSGINEIVRSALSEIEAYTRVERPELAPVDVKPGAVADVTHLLAELIENATNFSPPECRVRVMGDFVDDGYAVTVVDEGLGMRDDAIEEANQRINRQTSLDLTPTRTLGLYVVGRLAQRHGIRVRLLEGSLRGTVAKVVLPLAVLAEPRPAMPDPGPGWYRDERVGLPVSHRPPSAMPVVQTELVIAPPVRPEPVIAPPARPGGLEPPRPRRPPVPAAGREPMVARDPAVLREPVVGREPVAAGGVEERNGMRRRVRGAQLPQTQLHGLGQPEPAPSSEEGPERSEALRRQRDSLRSFQQAVDQGTHDGRSAGGGD